MIDLTNSGWKSGLREWILQRFTGIYIGIYSLFLFFYFINGIDYFSFVKLFSVFYFKVFSVLFIFSLALHSSIGIGIIITDYVKNVFFRIVLDFIINFSLLFYIFFVMQILWGFK
jgi:succinate dehydrogenase / fumarate reductase membrane anchor subunit